MSEDSESTANVLSELERHLQRAVASVQQQLVQIERGGRRLVDQEITLTTLRDLCDSVSEANEAIEAIEWEEEEEQQDDEIVAAASSKQPEPEKRRRKPSRKAAAVMQKQGAKKRGKSTSQRKEHHDRSATPPTVEEEDDDEDVADEDVADVAKRAPPGNGGGRKRPIPDGMAGRTADGHLVYFALANQLPPPAQNKRQKLWQCPSLAIIEGVEGEENECQSMSVTVARSDLHVVDFSSLNDDEKQWYVSHVEADILQRFDVNFPVLFMNAGQDMMQARQALLAHGMGATLLVQNGLETRCLQAATVTRTSPSLSAVNNIALMVELIVTFP